MIRFNHRRLRVALIGSVVLLLSAGLCFDVMAANDSVAAGDSVRIGPNDIGGVVRSPRGPEAGVWVIAERSDLPTRYAKIVVTDDAGRYLVPDLPPGRYQLWVRGYGLADSAGPA